jgi:hypothetical protein
LAYDRRTQKDGGVGMVNSIREGFEVFLTDGADPFGAVRHIDGPQAKEFVVYVENAGEFRVPLTAVDAVHEGKVILHRAKLEPGLQQAIRHAHEGEHEDQ